MKTGRQNMVNKLALYRKYQASKPKGKKGKGYSIYVTEPGKEPKEVDKI